MVSYHSRYDDSVASGLILPKLELVLKFMAVRFIVTTDNKWTMPEIWSTLFFSTQGQVTLETNCTIQLILKFLSRFHVIIINKFGQVVIIIKKI